MKKRFFIFRSLETVKRALSFVNKSMKKYYSQLNMINVREILLFYF